MMKIDLDEYRVRPGEAVDLTRRPTTVAALCKSEKHYADRQQKQVEHLSDLQQLLYATNRQAVLLILQAMDAAGKDGATQRRPLPLHRRPRAPPARQRHTHRQVLPASVAGEAAQAIHPAHRRPAEERKFRPQYMAACQACLGATSTNDSPWYVVPADSKNNTRLMVSQIVLDSFEALNLPYPIASPARVMKLKAIRCELTS